MSEDGSLNVGTILFVQFAFIMLHTLSPNFLTAVGGIFVLVALYKMAFVKSSPPARTESLILAELKRTGFLEKGKNFLRWALQGLFGISRGIEIGTEHKLSLAGLGLLISFFGTIAIPGTLLVFDILGTLLYFILKKAAVKTD